MFNKIYAFVVYSSKDPKKLSASIKWGGFLAIPYIMQAIGIACGFGYICIDVDKTTLEQIVQWASDISFHLFTAVGTFMLIKASLRKIWRTIKGENEALKGL